MCVSLLYVLQTGLASSGVAYLQRLSESITRLTEHLGLGLEIGMNPVQGKNQLVPCFVTVEVQPRRVQR